MTQRDGVVTAAIAGTAIGSFGGALKNAPLANLATAVAPADVGHAVMGKVILTEPSDACLSRMGIAAVFAQI